MTTYLRGSLSIDYSEIGEGPPVVLIHSSVSGNRQWKKLTALLSDRYRVIAPNLRGYGETTPWSGPKPQKLQDAAEVVLALCERLEGPIRLVGHSWGGAMALLSASQLGDRISHLALYEPMLRGLLSASKRLDAVAEYEAMRAHVERLGGTAKWMDLGRQFTDYFNGDGSWDALTAERQQMIATALPPNVHEWEAGSVPLDVNVFETITARCLLLRGTETQAVLDEISAVLHRRFPHWQLVLLSQ